MLNVLVQLNFALFVVSPFLSPATLTYGFLNDLCLHMWAPCFTVCGSASKTPKLAKVYANKAK
jgi:hypothetical protein